MKRFFHPFIALLFTFQLIATNGCDKEESVSSYAAPKDPQLLTWNLPADWHRASYNHRLQYAAFNAGDGDQVVKITVSYLFPNANGAKDLLLNVNRWRRQIGLSPISSSELGPLVSVTSPPGPTMQVVDLSGGDTGQRIRAMIAPRRDRIWFYKMTGTSEQIDANKQAFDDFARSVRYPTPEGELLLASAENPADLPAAPPTAPPIPVTSDAGELRYSLPAGWTREPNANAMRVATFSTGDPAPAQVIVTRLSANFGGMMLNLNRWRAEVGLPSSEGGAELKETALVIGGTAGSLVDLAGPGKDANAPHPMRSLIARCTRGDSVWFFKLLGPAETVTKQQTAFQAFLLSVQWPGD